MLLADKVANTGQLRADGQTGGRHDVQAGNILNAGSITAEGTQGAGGAVSIGFTGAYTTFSTFEYESDKMLREGDSFLGLTYIFVSLFLGLAAVRLGFYLARWR